MTSTVSAVARKGLRRDAGVGTLEYVGMVAVAAVLVVALTVHMWGSDLAGMTAQALCSVTRAINGQGAGCGVPTTQPPYEQAVSGRYMAMGDSYSSGEGAWDYEPGTDFDDRDDLWPFDDDDEAHNRCHRSADAYANVLSDSNAFAGGSTFVACSGSVISDLAKPNHKETGEEPQINVLDDDVSLRAERRSWPAVRRSTTSGSPTGCLNCAASCWMPTDRSRSRLPTPGSSSSVIRSSSSTTPATTTATRSSPRTRSG